MKTLRINCVCNCAVPGCTGFVLTLQLCFHPENSELSLQATNCSRDYCEVVVLPRLKTPEDEAKQSADVWKSSLVLKMVSRKKCYQMPQFKFFKCLTCRFRFCFSFFLRLVINWKHLRINGKFYCMFAKMCFQSLITVFTGVSGIVEGKHERSLSVIRSNWHVSRTESLLFWFRASKRSV